MPDDSLFMTMDAAKLQSNLVQFLCRTAKMKGRIEINNDDGTNCVIISKEELQDLERALEILSDSEAGRAIQRAIERFAVMTQDALPDQA